MSSTKETLGPYDALEQAELGEPMFPLLGRDPDAPATITEWCRLRRNRLFKEHGGSDDVRDQKLFADGLRKCAHAENVAIELEEWRKADTARDLPGERAAYQDVIRSAEETIAAETRTMLDAALRHLRESDYHMIAAFEKLTELEQLSPEFQATIREQSEFLKSLAEALTPKRPEFAQPQLPLPPEAANG